MNVKTTCQGELLTREEKLKVVDEILSDYDYREDNLIQILHLIQGMNGYLPIELQQYIAKEMELPLSKISGVISFYTLFSTEKKGKYVIKVCLGTACYVRGGKKLIHRLKELTGIDVGQTSEDGKYTLEITRCIGACGLSPTMMINDNVCTQVKQERLMDLLKAYED